MNSTGNCVVNDTPDTHNTTVATAPVASDKMPPTNSSTSTDLVPVTPLSPPAEFPPEFKSTFLELEAVAGSSTKFVCQLNNASNCSKIGWYHNGVPVTSSDRHLFLQDGDFFCVQINQVRPADQGEWTLRAETPAGRMCCCCILHVTCPPIFSPPEFISGLRGVLWDNGTISLECEVKGRPTPSLRWYKDGSQILEGASLTIKASAKEPETLLGIFACEAQNCMGSRALYSKVYAKNFCDYLARMNRAKQPQMQLQQGQTDIKQITSS